MSENISGTGSDSVSLDDSESAEPRRPRFLKWALWGLLGGVAIGGIALLGWGARYYREYGSAIPIQTMPIEFGDIGGVAAVTTPAFEILFEGESFNYRAFGGLFHIDGRYQNSGLRATWQPPHEYDGENVKRAYSPHYRATKFDVRGYRFEYSHPRRKLTVNGQEFSTAEGQVRLLMKKNGEVERLPSPVSPKPDGQR